MNLSSIKEILQKNGVIGLGGGGFPSFLKLDKNINTFIINCAECEPLLKSDYFFLKYNFKKILEVVKLYREILSLKRVIIAIKEKNLHLLSTLTLEKFKIELFKLKDFYPVGDEKILIKLLDDVLIETEKFPKDYGYLVHNASTCGAIYDAVFLNKPLIKRFVTVTGEVTNPYVGEVKVGSPILKLFEKAGMLNPENCEVIEGGIMTGKLSSKYGYIKKTTGGIFLLPEDNRAVIERKQSVSYILKSGFERCCDCDKCTELCSRSNIGFYLKPDRLVKSYGKYFDNSILNCSNCGLCSLFACPFQLSPRNVINFLKKKKEGLLNNKSNLITGKHFSNLFVSSNRLKKRLNLEKYGKSLKFVGEVFLKGEYVVELPRGTKWKNFSKGDYVKESEPLNDVLEWFGYNVHSPIDGKIVLVEDNFLKILN